MKKLSHIFFAAIAVCLLFSACNQSNKTKDAEIEIEDSVKFSKEEISQAMDSVKKKFADFEGCTLVQLWYDEAKSDAFIEGYMISGRGSINGISKENVVVLLSTFDVDSSGGKNGFNPDSTYTDWNWILIRDGNTEKWKIDDWGY